MRTLAGLVAAFVVTASLTLPCLADELITNDGESHTCEILKVEEDGVTARGKLKTGEVVELKIPAARLDPACFYALRDASIGNDAKARMRLAMWCVENDLISRAKIQVKKAAAADPKLIEDLVGGAYPEIREKMAARVLKSAESDVASGQYDTARQKLEILLARLSDTEAGGKARDVIRTCEAKCAEAEAKAAADAQAKLDEAARKAGESRAKLLAAVDEDYAKGRAYATEGLTEDNVANALELMEKALHQGEAAIKKLDAIDKDHAGDAELLTEAAARRKKTNTGIVKVYIHRSDLYIWRGSLPNAKKELEAARAIDPSNPEIQAAMERVLAADDDDALELRYLRERRQTGTRFSGSRAGGGRGR
jgi:tetratricopeptide (TPR) repeat protein